MLDKEAYFSVASNTDAWLRLAGVLTEEELLRAVEGAMNVYVVMEHEFARRFPEAYARYEKQFND